MTNNGRHTGQLRPRPHRDDNGGTFRMKSKPSFSARFYAFLYRVLPDWLSYRLLSSGVPDMRYWGERGNQPAD